jgi:predicted GTPase
VEVTVVDTAGSARRGRGAGAGTPDELAAQVARVRTRALGGGAEVGVVVVDVSAPAGGPVDERAGVPPPPPLAGSAGWRGGAGLTRGEATGLREAWRRGLAVVVAATKADRLANLSAKEIQRVRREVEGALARALPEAAGAPVVLCSAPPEADRSAGAEVGGLEMLLQESARLRARRARHTKTSRLNRWWRKVQGSENAPPEARRVRFLVQTGAAPPAFAVFARWGAGGRQSRAGGEPLSGSSLRWVEGRLREFLQLQGVPLELDVRLSEREGKGGPGR